MDIELQKSSSRGEEGNREGDEEVNVELCEDIEREVEEDENSEREGSEKKEDQAGDSETKAVEASAYILQQFNGKTLKKRFQLIKGEWSYPAINANHVKTILASFIFYKFLFLFVTRFEY